MDQNKMEEDKSLQFLGYQFIHPSKDDHNQVYKLNIHITELPGEHHFDVMHAIFLTGKKGIIQQTTVQHPWYFEKTFRACAGMIILNDRKGKIQEAFSFGGNIQIDSHETYTDCILESSAPILDVTHATPTHKLFIDEIEILLATRKAAYSDHKKYEKKLFELEPSELYQACIDELISKFEEWPQKSTPYIELLHFLHSERKPPEVSGYQKLIPRKLSDIL